MTEPGDLEPPPPVPPSGGPGNGDGNPWEQRDRLGFFPALLENVKLFVTSPGEAFARTRRSGDYLSPFVFAILMGWVGAILGSIWSLLFGAWFLTAFPGEMGDQLGPMLAIGGMGFFATLILAPIFVAIFLFIWSGILHLCLVVVSALGESESGFEGTFRVAGYSSVAQLAQVVPFAGGLITLVWSIFLLVVGLSDLHRTTQGRALAAVLIPVALCCVCAVVAIVVFGAGIAAFLASQS
ncbi:MAG: YIP1 family protein [Thermoanaerobaculia bacterium]